MRTSLLLLIAALAAGCGDGRARTPGTGTATPRTNNTSNDAGVATGEHAARCNQACADSSGGPCSSNPVGNCNADCDTVTSALSASCASCVLARSGWTGDACTCYGEGCNLCGFSPGDNACSGAQPSDTCAVEDEVCEGYEWEKISSGPCKDICFAETPTDLPQTLSARCELLCRPSERACSGASTADCMTACMTQVSGLEGGCALCVIEQSAWSGRACTCDGPGCSLCRFGPSDSPCASSGPESTCAPEDEICDGMSFGSPVGECADLCGG